MDIIKTIKSGKKCRAWAFNDSYIYTINELSSCIDVYDYFTNNAIKTIDLKSGRGIEIKIKHGHGYIIVSTKLKKNKFNIDLYTELGTYVKTIKYSESV